MPYQMNPLLINRIRSVDPYWKKNEKYQTYRSLIMCGPSDNEGPYCQYLALIFFHYGPHIRG